MSAAQDSSKLATVTGTVADAEGHFVSGARVRLQAGHRGVPMIVQTDAKGGYRFSGVAAGVYTLKAEDRERGEFALQIVLAEGQTRAVNLKFPAKKALGAASGAKPEFFDEPNFTVAGVTDTTSLGGHGSDNVVRSRDSMAKDAAKLREAAEESAAAAAGPEEGRQSSNDEVAQASQTPLLSNRDQAELHHVLADLDERKGKPLEAVREYEQAAKMYPSEPYFFDWGAELLLHHAPEPASEVFSRGTRLYPKSVRMRVGLGAAEFARGLDEQATHDLCEASDLDPARAEPYLFLGKIESAEKVPPENLVEKLERFADLKPDDAMANYYYALGLWKRRNPDGKGGDSARVQGLLEKAIQLDPKLDLAFLQLGIVHVEQRDFATAIAAFQQAVQANPDFAEAHYRLAQAYRQAGDRERARAELEIYEKISQGDAKDQERRRHEIQQFVYTLRDPAAAPAATPH